MRVEASANERLSLSIRGAVQGVGFRPSLSEEHPMTIADFAAACPLPLSDHPQVLLAHGGGRMTQQLIERVLLPAFANPALAERHDGAVLAIGGARLAFTTDSYVVRPLVFPGGDIGTLAVLRAHPHDVGACQIGVVEGAAPGQVTITSLIGTHRLVELPSGEQLPRIC